MSGYPEHFQSIPERELLVNEQTGSRYVVHRIPHEDDTWTVTITFVGGPAMREADESGQRRHGFRSKLTREEALSAPADWIEYAWPNARMTYRPGDRDS